MLIDNLAIINVEYRYAQDVIKRLRDKKVSWEIIFLFNKIKMEPL